MNASALRLLAIAALLLLGAAGSQAFALPGVAGDRLPITIVGLGDSVTSGAHCGCAGFITDYAHLLGRTRHIPVYGINLGRNGATSADLLASIRSGKPAVRPLSRADIVVITIGANDFVPDITYIHSGQCGGLSCTNGTMTTMADNVGAIIERVERLRSGKSVTIKVTGYWNVFEDGATARSDYSPQFRRDSDILTRRVNATLDRVATARHVDYVDLYVPFKGRTGTIDDTHLLAPDGDHPNAAGHEAIARALLTS